jgi:signal transduction histidine kinase
MSENEEAENIARKSPKDGIETKELIPLSSMQIAVDKGQLELQSPRGKEIFPDDELWIWRPVIENLTQGIVDRKSLSDKSKFLSIFEVENNQLPFWYKEKFRIVLRELVLNSIKAIQKKGGIGIIQIDSHIDEESKEFVLSISDDGVGIDEENKQKMFNKGYTTKMNEIKETVGNGLYRSREFVEKILGGRLDAYDNRMDLGKEQPGATFIITLKVS